MSSEIALDYTDVLKAYQNKSGELLTQLITAEAKVNASAGIIKDLKNQIVELKSQNSLLESKNNVLESQKQEVSRLNQKLSKSTPKPTKKTSASTDVVVDYNS